MTLFLVVTVLAWLFGILCSLHSLRLGFITREAGRQSLRRDNLPPVSIIMTVHNQQSALQSNLPAILSQNYSAPFEVIVVDMNSEDDTLKVLEEMEKENVHLHHTFCPDTARDISISRLAFTLGFRSACYEWVLMISPDVTPLSSRWLLGMAQALRNDVDAAQGFIFYGSPHGWFGAKCHFFRLWQQSLWMPWMTHFTPYRADSSCLAYRKSLFMSHQGFASSFSLRFGAGTLLVNHNVKRHRMALAMHPDAFLMQQQPTCQTWLQHRVFHMETRRHMHHAIPYRLWYAMRILGNYIWIPLAAFALLTFNLPIYIMYMCVVLWLLSLTMASISWYAMARMMRVRSYALLYPLLQALVPWWDICAWLHWRFESRKTFRKKFV